jgi:hypothetical protein
VYELTMDKDQRLRYLFDGEWHMLETKTVAIPVYTSRSPKAPAAASVLIDMIC